MSIINRFTSRPWTFPVILTALLCSIGIWWGYGEIWNADQMAFKDHFREGAWPFSPAKFDKPPLYSYINFVFSVAPREVLVHVAGLVTGEDFDGRLDFVSVWLAKILQLLFACGSVYLVDRICNRIVQERAAAYSATLLAVSAGFIVQAHFISTDLPVVFFMLLAFWACQRLLDHRSVRDYFIAGVCIGLTGAMKYNGLVVGLALPIFHVVGSESGRYIRPLFEAKHILALVSVIFGFLLANPYAAIEFNRFASDLNYLFTVAAPYVGAMSEVSREANVLKMLATDHLGWPLAVLIVPAVIFALRSMVKERRPELTATLLASFGIAVIYALYFYSQGQVQVRWVLVLVPFVLIISAPSWAYLFDSGRRVGHAVMLCLVIYGAVCSVFVGIRFSLDPRIDAIAWVNDNARYNALIETSNYTPDWKMHVEQDVVVIQMARISGRKRVFEEVFEDRSDILEELEDREKAKPEWYSLENLAARSPDFIAVSSIYFERFFSGEIEDEYPEIKAYFGALLDEKSGYEIAFDESCCEPIPLLFPKRILFVDNRIVILERTQPTNGSRLIASPIAGSTTEH